jgi:hypothetical protein
LKKKERKKRERDERKRRYAELNMYIDIDLKYGCGGVTTSDS